MIRLPNDAPSFLKQAGKRIQGQANAAAAAGLGGGGKQLTNTRQPAGGSPPTGKGGKDGGKDPKGKKGGPKGKTLRSREEFCPDMTCKPCLVLTLALMRVAQVALFHRDVGKKRGPQYSRLQSLILRPVERAAENLRQRQISAKAGQLVRRIPVFRPIKLMVTRETTTSRRLRLTVPSRQ